jgi:hypothetical protein
MELIVTNRIKRELSIPTVKGMDMAGNILRVFFSNEQDSYSAFQRIREFGLRCCHAGVNAPDGPMVMMSHIHQSDYNLKFR